MSLQHLAHHIAAKGRHGDDTLVHVSKDELAGLQALAKKNGTTLTINPQTGLPEAFGLRQLLPMAAGAAISVGSGGTIDPITAAALVGGGTYMATGSLQQGVMAGMGAWGGAGLAQGITAAGTQQMAGEKLAEEAAKNQITNEASIQAAKDQAAKELAAKTTTETAVNTGFGNSAGTLGLNTTGAATISPTAGGSSFMQNAGNADFMYDLPYNNALVNTSTYANTANASNLAAAKAASTPTELFTKGFTNLGTEAGRSAAVSGMGGGWGAAKYGLAAAAPSIYESMQPKPYEQPNIQGDADMGPRYMFDSGYSNDIPGRTGPASYKRMSPEEAKKYYGFAEGGEVQYPYGESVVRMAEGGSADQQKAIMGAFNNSQFGASNKIAKDATFLNDPSPQLEAIFGRLNAGEDTGEEYVRRMADGGVAGGNLGLGVDYSGYDAPVNQGITSAASRGNVNQNIADLYSKIQSTQTGDSYEPYTYNGGFSNISKSPLNPLFASMTGARVVGLDENKNPIFGGGSMDKVYRRSNDPRNPYGVTYDKDSNEFSDYSYMLRNSAYAEGGSVEGKFMPNDLKHYASGGITHLASGGRMQYSSKDVTNRYSIAAPMSNSGYDDAPVQDYRSYYQQARPSQYVSPIRTSEYGDGYDSARATGDAIARDFSPLLTIKPEKYTESGGLPTMSTNQFATLVREQKERDAANMPTRDYSNYYQQARQSAPVQYSVPVTAGYEPTGYSYGYSGYNDPVQAGVSAIPVKGFQYDPAVLQSIRAANEPAPVVSTTETSGGGDVDGLSGGTGGAFAAGGIANLGGYSDGGRLLKGPGDGMSDNIPAQIGQKQPARLADGEFVVPADVVSHLGNGSTDAGAKQLYKMMDNIRKARTGRKSQGKQINPRKYMPA